ncbi:MAG: glutamate-1-semialdehyde 2,1-aminomutase [Gemmatimonadota bacterium]|nr:glutamate-1-semialdehyde 2,1-aminomutase [Gemmatimonadota bacterium]
MARARDLFPGGVNSPARAFGGVGGEPFVVDRGEGPRLFDVDGREYIDYVMSWGALALGHASPPVIDAITETALKGTSFGAPTELEVALAEQVTARMPHVEMMRFVSSGTEATMSAIRLARAVTKREMILKFDGCYHGHADAFLVRAGSGVATFGLPNSPGVPEAIASLTLSAPFNDVGALGEISTAHGDRLAAIIVEPVVGNGGFIAPDLAFLRALRTTCDDTGALLIFDEVMTGFRIAPGGAVERFGVRPDLTTLGKVLGGGLPAAAYGGPRELMERIAPSGPVYQAGTLSGNPLAMAAGLATLRILTPMLHQKVEARASRLVGEMRAIAARLSIPFTADCAGSMFGFFFRAEPVRSFRDARESDVEMFRRFFHAMLEEGIYLPPSPFEASFVSAAHGDAEIDATLERTERAMRAARA